MDRMRPTSKDKVLDVGVSEYTFRGTNFLEQWYPWPGNITALSNDDPKEFDDFLKKFPKTNLVFEDGRALSFPDNAFNVVFSNAVVEHVGSRDNQRKFIHEIVRVSKRAFISTPNRWFPVDAHTLIPFAHWLPVRARFLIFRVLGRGYWADLNRLNLLSKKEFVKLFPPHIKLQVYGQKVFGILHSLNAIVEK
ncbi:MAG: methyltransferase domain-containing protein [Deltaproteobacteria bacterium]|nr:methyltransferase domain-containing protein [Deltaproteobacteria bacterium]